MAATLRFLDALHSEEVTEQAAPSIDEARLDASAILASFQLQTIRRYFNQIHWLSETAEAINSDAVEPGLKLESVAAHSWHVADTALLVAPHFGWIDLSRVTSLAILHDKLEIIIGDYDPVGRDGWGTETHAFHPRAKQVKRDAELRALEIYLSNLRPSARDFQRRVLMEVIEGRTQEALFVKAIDKIQALSYVIKKKNGNITDEHIAFSLRYAGSSVTSFPPIINHFIAMTELLFNSVARHRGLPPEVVMEEVMLKFEVYLCGR